MSISNGTLANATNFNAAFTSRTAAQSISGGKTFSNYIAETPEDVATTATIAALSSSTSNVRMTGSTATTIQGIVAGVSGQQLRLYNASSAVVTLSNQNVTASAANRFSSFSGSDVTLAAGACIFLRYDSTLSRWVQDTNAVGAVSSGGGLNYITDTDGLSIGSWVTYADAAGTSPVDGTGGSPSSTFAVSTDSSMVGTSNFLWSKSAANRQGEGFSVNFSIDQAYQSKPLTVSFLYKIASGTYADDDMRVWLYDVTNSTLIQPTPYLIKNAVGASVMKCEFQAASNSTSYRLIVHTASTSASAYTIRFDSFSVSPTMFISGASVSDWILETRISATAFGTTANSNIYSRRVGGELQVRGYIQAGTPTGSTASLDFSGLTIDASKFGNKSSVVILGQGNQIKVASGGSGLFTAGYSQNIFYDGSTTNKAFIGTSVQNNVIDKAVGTSVVDTNGYYSFEFSVPILGWGTSQVLSTDTDTRVVSATYFVSSASLAVSANSQINFDTKVSDTHGAVTTGSGWKFTAPIPGKYKVSPTSLYSSGTASRLTVYKNGFIVANFGVMGTAGGQVSYASGSINLDLVAGDYVDCRVTNATTLSGSSSTPYDTFISIERLSSPAQIAASEKVYAQYTGNAGTALTANTTNVDFSTKVSDSHGAWNGTQFIAPRAGWYNFNGSYKTTAGTANNVYLYVDAVQKYNVTTSVSTSALKNFAGGTYLNAGQTVSFRPDGNETLLNSATTHWLAITSQG